MSEDFDTELARAVKDSAARSLEGWEFTRAMQRSVLERIESAAMGTVPAARPSRRFDAGRIIRPLAWTAVAAAALVVVVNTGVGERGGATKNAPAAQSATGSAVAQGPTSAENAQQPGTVAPAPGTAQGESGPRSLGTREDAARRAAAPGPRRPRPRRRRPRPRRTARRH